MNRYLLLRKNKESGPYSLDELKDQNLFPLDLIWLEGKSRSWKYASEFDELKSCIREEEKIPVSVRPALSPEKEKAQLQTALFYSGRDGVKDRPFYINMEPAGGTYLRPLERLKERPYAPSAKKIPVWKKRIMGSQNIKNVLALILVFLGLAVTAAVIKRLVDGIPGNTGTYAPSVRVTVPAPEIPESSPSAALGKVVTVSKGNVEKSLLKSQPVQDIQYQVKVTGSDFKTGLLGGISDLRVSIYNESPFLIEELLVTVDILKPSGAVIESRNFTVTSLKPGSIHQLNVPPTDRGVKVNFRVTGIRSAAYKAAVLKQA